MKLIAALVKKEFFQIIRDPSSILIAFVLPLILLTIFAYAINLDNNQIKMGLVIEGEQYQVNEFLSGFEGTRYLNLTRYPDRPAAIQALVRGDIKAAIILASSCCSGVKARVFNSETTALAFAKSPEVI